MLNSLDVALPKSAVAIYSGGLDSTALLYAMKDAGVDILGALSVDYGQKHNKELARAASICESLGIEHRILDLRAIGEIFGKSSLTDDRVDIPEGHYEEAQMKSTVVPNRNMLLISLGVSWGISLGAEVVAYAAHGGDHAIYPDCRMEFADALNEAVKLCDWKAIELYRPFVKKTKADIVGIGQACGAPLERTWSCYKGGAIHCGRCGTCIERREAFYLAKVEDPTEYDESAPKLETLIASGWKFEK